MNNIINASDKTSSLSLSFSVRLACHHYILSISYNLDLTELILLEELIRDKQMSFLANC